MCKRTKRPDEPAGSAQTNTCTQTETPVCNPRRAFPDSVTFVYLFVVAFFFF